MKNVLAFLIIMSFVLLTNGCKTQEYSDEQIMNILTDGSSGYWSLQKKRPVFIRRYNSNGSTWELDEHGDFFPERHYDGITPKKLIIKNHHLDIYFDNNLPKDTLECFDICKVGRKKMVIDRGSGPENYYKININDIINDEKQVYSFVDTMPSFPGGASQMVTFFRSNFHYPKKTMESGIQGRLVARFIVEIDGSISNIKMLQKLEPHLDKKFIRVLKKMPHWIPGKHHGKTVRVRLAIPICVDNPQ